MEETEKISQQVLEPVLQDEIPFRGHTITAVRLSDGRIAVVLRWICEVLNLDPQGQVQRIQRTAAIAGELLRVKVQPRMVGEKPKRGGGAQAMPVLTLRGFSPWILGINPNEVEKDPQDPEKAEYIRQMIIAYQVEAVDVLYTHFMQRARLLPEPGDAETHAVIVPTAEPIKPKQEPASGASDAELTSYYEDLAVWAYWKAKKHAQAWRSEVQNRIEDQEARIEAKEAVLDLIPEILDRLGPETISTQQQRQIQVYVKQLNQLTGKPYATIHDELKMVFEKPRYQDLLASEWSQVNNWFKLQIQRAKEQRQ
jgi:hypothetical protein